MNRQDFYLNLALELNMLKVPPELINTHIDQFKQYLQTLSEEDAEKQIASFGEIKDLAANIYRLLCGTENSPAMQKESAQTTETVYDIFRVESEEETDTIDQEPMPEVPQINPQPEEAIDDIGENSISLIDANTELELDFDIYNPNDYVAPDPELFDEAGISQNRNPVNIPSKKRPDTPVHPHSPSNPAPNAEQDEELFLDEEDTHKNILRDNNSALFWVLFVITLPITVPLFITLMSVFGFSYIIIALLIAVTFVSIFLTAIAGAVMVMVGGLYGISQLRAANSAIGLFELGLALVIAGATLLLCHIFYLLSMRLFPKMFKYLTRFLRFFLDKFLCLIEKIKKECASK